MFFSPWFPQTVQPNSRDGKKAIEKEWKRIAGTVWTACQDAGLTRDEDGITAFDRKARFDAQIASFVSFSWQARLGQTPGRRLETCRRLRA